jgi:hypothetical protein
MLPFDDIACCVATAVKPCPTLFPPLVRGCLHGCFDEGSSLQSMKNRPTPIGVDLSRLTIRHAKSIQVNMNGFWCNVQCTIGAATARSRRPPGVRFKPKFHNTKNTALFVRNLS